MMEEIRLASSLGHITEEAGLKCLKELETIKATQRRLESAFGPSVIHADLSLGNILITEQGLVPIDFSLSGYGSLAQEDGMLMSNYRDDESCQKLLDGFDKAGVKIDATDADIFLSYSVLLFICSHHNKVFREEWFGNALKMWCENMFVH